jgi:hypothetical protein
MGYIARRMHRASNQEFAQPIDIPMELTATEARDRLEAAFHARLAQLKVDKEAKRQRLSQGNGLQRWWGKNAVGGQVTTSEMGWNAQWAAGHLAWQGGTVLVGYYAAPEFILKQPKRPIGHHHWWLARVRVEDRKAVVTLVRWLTGDDGKIISRDFYIEFVAWIEEAMGVGAVEAEAR